MEFIFEKFFALDYIRMIKHFDYFILSLMNVKYFFVVISTDLNCEILLLSIRRLDLFVAFEYSGMHPLSKLNTFFVLVDKGILIIDLIKMSFF